MKREGDTEREREREAKRQREIDPETKMLRGTEHDDAKTTR